MTERKITHLDHLVDWLVEETLSMSDEEILAEADPADIEKAKQAFERALEAATTKAMFGGWPQKQRQTALRLRGNAFETVEIGDDGKVIEPLRCNCSPVVHWRSDCPFAYGVT